MIELEVLLSLYPVKGLLYFSSSVIGVDVALLCFVSQKV